MSTNLLGPFKPAILDLAVIEDAVRFAALREQPGIQVIDTLADQLQALVRSREPSRTFSATSADQAIAAVVGPAATAYGRWIHYPWSHALVRLLPPAEFHELRTDRNRHKISRLEQETLRTKRIGVVGLSVGHSIALTLAQEGIGGSFRIADFDTLELSNLNRLRASLASLGENKAVIAARDLAEIDPYLDIEIYPDGVTQENCAAFLGDGQDALDLLVEECDDLAMKVMLRQAARRRRIPVVMETSDRGMLDVERYDKQPDMPILHNLLEGFDLDALAGATAKEKVPLALSVLGIDEMSVGARASLVEIQQSVSTWPQLASAIMLGSALVTDAARRILLGTFTTSGRFRVDIEALVSDGTQADAGAANTFSVVPSDESVKPPTAVRRPPRRTGPIERPEIEFLVSHGVLAPSGGNTQPWVFTARDHEIDCSLSFADGPTYLDVDGLAGRVAMGAAIENIDLAARELGIETDIHEKTGDRSNVAATIRVTRGSPAPDVLFDAVHTRVSNRRPGTRQPLPRSVIGDLRREAEARGARLHIIEDPETLAKVGQAVGECDRLRFFSERMRSELFSELRFTPQAALDTRDGLELPTLEMGPLDRAALEVLASPDVVQRVRQIGGGTVFVDTARRQLEGSSAAVLITYADDTPEGYLRGGRAMQRVWLSATRHGLAVHPYGVACFLFARLARNKASSDMAEALANLRERYDALWGIDDNPARIMLLRLSSAEPPTARSIRRPLASALHWQ